MKRPFVMVADKAEKDAETDLLAFHIAIGRVDTKGREVWIAAAS
jgi:hypothetical protein